MCYMTYYKASSWYNIIAVGHLRVLKYLMTGDLF